MSIYSGFPTRRDEQKYNSLLSKLLSILQDHLLSLLGPTPELPPKYTRSYTKILTRMREYEEHKYLPPKFTQVVQGISKLVGLPEGRELRAVQERSQAEMDEGIGIGISGGDRKASSRSLHKGRFNTGIGIHEQQTAPPKKFLLPTGKDQRHTQSPPKNNPNDKVTSHSPLNLPPRALFQSCSSKLSRPKALKGIFPANHRVDLSQQYEQPLQWQAGRPRVGSQGGRVRYRAFQALQEAQEQIKIKSRPVPLREEMRRKLKTEGQAEMPNGEGEALPKGI